MIKYFYLFDLLKYQQDKQNGEIFYFVTGYYFVP